MSLRDDLTATKSGLYSWQYEHNRLAITDMICEQITRLGVSRRKLAGRLGITVTRLNELLDSAEPFTVKDVSMMLTALGLQLKVGVEKIEKTKGNK